MANGSKPTTSNSDSPTQQLKTESSSGIGTTIFSSAVNMNHHIVHNNNNNNHNNNNNNLMLLRNGSAATTPASLFSPTTNPMGSVFSQAGTPSDTTSSLSSFTTSTGGHPMLMSPESMDSVVLTMSPVDMAAGRIGIVGKTSTFKALQNRKSMDLDAAISSSFIGPMVIGSNGNDVGEMNMRMAGGQRPTPPCTLNLLPLR